MRGGGGGGGQITGRGGGGRREWVGPRGWAWRRRGSLACGTTTTSGWWVGGCRTRRRYWSSAGCLQMSMLTPTGSRGLAANTARATMAGKRNLTRVLPPSSHPRSCTSLARTRGRRSWLQHKSAKTFSTLSGGVKLGMGRPRTARSMVCSRQVTVGGIAGRSCRRTTPGC